MKVVQPMPARQTIELDEDGRIVIPDDHDEVAAREMFHSVQSANSAVYAAEMKLRDGVERLRGEGTSWSVIGSLLGMSRGGAQKKFSRPIKRVSADELREAAKTSPQISWHPHTELLAGLTAEMSDRAVVKHLSRGGPTVVTLDALSYLTNEVRVRSLTLPGRSHSESERLLLKAEARVTG